MSSDTTRIMLLRVDLLPIVQLWGRKSFDRVQVEDMDGGWDEVLLLPEVTEFFLAATDINFQHSLTNLMALLYSLC